MDFHAQFLGVKMAEFDMDQAFRQGRTSLHVGTIFREAKMPLLDYRAISRRVK